MFAYPERALYHRVIPKNKVYGHTLPSRALRQRFVNQVAEIVWQYKLAPATVNLPGGAQMQEIQVFSIACRTAEIKEDRRLGQAEVRLSAAWLEHLEHLVGG